MTDVKVCNFLAEKLATRHPVDLSPAERAELNAHIASCLACATKQADYNMLTTRIRQLPAAVPLAATTHEFFWRDAASSQRASVRPIRAFTPLPFRTISISAGTLVAAMILIVSLVLLQQTHSGTASKLSVASQNQNATSTISIAANSCPVPTTPDRAISCTASYTGNIIDGENMASSPLQLTVRQRQDVLTGSCTLSLPALSTLSTSFSGTIDTHGKMQFRIQPDSNTIITFNGTVNPNDKTLSGSYLTNTGLTGTWSVHLL